MTNYMSRGIAHVSMVLAFDQRENSKWFVCLHPVKNYPTLLNRKEDFALAWAVN
jgi:hypothetical protein